MNWAIYIYIKKYILSYILIYNISKIEIKKYPSSRMYTITPLNVKFLAIELIK